MDEKLQQRSRLQQCNLELYSNEPLSVLASNSLRGKRDGSVIDALEAEVYGGCKPMRVKGVTGSSLSGDRGSCSSDQESSGDTPSPDETTEEATRGRMEFHVYGELACIRDKIKERLQTLAVEERKVQQMMSEVAAEEVEVKKMKDEVKEREMELREREIELREREEKLNKQEEEIRKKKDELERRESTITCQEEVLGKREVEIERGECDVSSRERALSGREERVREMERLACEAHKGLIQCIENEVHLRVEEMEGGQREVTERLEKELKERTRDLKRLRQCYEAVKQANESLRKELKEKQERNSKLRSQLSVSHSRVVGLQKRNEQLMTSRQQQQLTLAAEVDTLKQKFSKLHSSEKKKADMSTDGVCCEVLGAVINWLCAVYLSQPLSAPQLADVQQTSSKILPSIAPLMSRVSSPSLLDDLQQPLLLFVYWCVAHLSSSKQQKSALASTLRRIGEAVYKPMGSEDRGEKGEGVFFNSSDINIRMLSCLLIIHTVTQVDSLAVVFEQLQCDLKEHRRAQQLFLLYHGVDCVLPYMKASYRVLCTLTVNVYLILSVESALLPQFLRTLSTERWFSACAALLRESSDLATLEKISIILQRLSKIKGAHSLFESQRVRVIVQSLLRERHSQPNSSFFILNLQSTLTNLDHNTHHL